MKTGGFARSRIERPFAPGRAIAAGAFLGGPPIREVARKLAEIVRQHGPQVADDERKLDRLLTEACGPKFANEILMLVTAAMARVPAELRSTEAHLVTDADLARLARRVQSEFGVNESLARWSVATWAFALGVPGPNPAGSVATASTLGAPPAAERYPVSREGLLAAIRDAKADGVVTPEERESLRQLAGRVRLQLGDDALLPREAPSRRRWMIPMLIGALALVVIVVVVLLPSRSEAPSAQTLATQLTQEEPAAVEDGLAESERQRAAARLREQMSVAREQLAALRERHATARVEVQAFADRLRRAAQQARDQSRVTFGMAGRTYDQTLAHETLALAERYVADRERDETAIGSELQRMDQQIQQADASPDDAAPSGLAPATVPTREVPVFDLGAR